MVKIDALKSVLTKTQPDLKEMVKKYITKKGYKSVEGDGYLYGKGDIPIMLVAHLDIVHKKPPEQIFFDQEQFIVWSPTGIGGDDRCGVYLIMQILNKGYKPHVLFLEDEEKGCVGAKKCVKDLERPRVKFLVEIDRRGEKDCVFYDCGNRDFQSYIESFGFEKAIGSYSDICELSDVWEIASVNLSAGYYNEHTEREYINLYHLNKTFMAVRKILEDDANNKVYYDYNKVIYKAFYTSKKNNKQLTYNDYDNAYLGGVEGVDGCIYYDYGYYDQKGQWHWYSEM